MPQTPTENGSQPEFLEIEAIGDGFERGVAHGEAVREWILPYHGPSLREKAERSPEAKAVIEQAMAYLNERFPDLVEELRGIAHGAKMEFWDIVLWNYRRVFDVCPPCCTNFALRETRLGPALCGTVDGGQPPTPREPYPIFIQRFQPRKGYRVLASVLPGTIWIEKGLNEHGLAIGNSGLATTDVEPRGVPFHTTYRQALLNCRDVEEATRFFQGISQVCFGGVFAFVDAAGGAAIIEKSPTRQAVFPATDNWVGSANSFTAPDLQEVEVRTPERVEEAARRRETMAEFAARVGTSADLDDLLAFIRSHGPPAAICRHGGKDLSHTRECYVILCAERRMLAGTRGYACEARMESFSL